MSMLSVVKAIVDVPSGENMVVRPVNDRVGRVLAFRRGILRTVISSGLQAPLDVI